MTLGVRFGLLDTLKLPPTIADDVIIDVDAVEAMLSIMLLGFEAGAFAVEDTEAFVVLAALVIADVDGVVVGGF